MTVKPLMRVRFGSHLYGTSTPASDTDWKGVHLPSAFGLVMGRHENHIDRSTKKDTSVKNTADDVDDESFSLAKFFDMIAKGDTVAIELLYAPPEMLEFTTPEWEEIRAARHLLVNRQIKGFVGYCQRQAAKYGIRGSRIAAVRQAVRLLDAAIKEFGNNAKMGQFEKAWWDFAASHEHVEIVPLANQYGAEILHLDVCDRKMGWTTTVKFARDVYAKVLENYGHRALAAEQNKGVDWKAVSHAVRVGRQATELLRTGEIQFPRPDAASLIAIKLGQIPYDEVSKELESAIAQVEQEALTSKLADRSDRELMDAFLFRFHLNQIQNEYRA